MCPQKWRTFFDDVMSQSKLTTSVFYFSDLAFGPSAVVTRLSSTLTWNVVSVLNSVSRISDSE